MHLAWLMSGSYTCYCENVLDHPLEFRSICVSLFWKVVCVIIPKIVFQIGRYSTSCLFYRLGEFTNYFLDSLLDIK